MDARSWRDEQRNLRDAVRTRRQSEPGEQRDTAGIAIEPLGLQPLDLLATPIVSQRGAPGRAVIGTKRLLRRLLAPFLLEPQTKFNQEVVAVLAEQHAQLAALSSRQALSLTVDEAPFDYAGFEDSFRGSTDAIAARQAEYLPYLIDHGEILDVGCGRGELLAMLHARGASARGVDVDAEMVARCHRQGLPAEHADAVEYLERQPDGFFGAVFMSQVVEHLTSDYLATLLDAIGRKTRQEGVLIVETLNPESLPVLTRWFWLDPTHVRLLHPETLQFFMRQAGFEIKTVQFRNEVADEDRLPQLRLDGVSERSLASFNDSVEALNARLFGALDYFVVGQNRT